MFGRVVEGMYPRMRRSCLVPRAQAQEGSAADSGQRSVTDAAAGDGATSADVPAFESLEHLAFGGATIEALGTDQSSGSGSGVAAVGAVLLVIYSV